MKIKKTLLLTTLISTVSPNLLAGTIYINVQNYYLPHAGMYKCRLNISNNTAKHLVTYATTEFDKLGLPLARNVVTSDISRGNFTFEDWRSHQGNTSAHYQTCSVTDATIEGYGRAHIRYTGLNSGQTSHISAALSWNTLDEGKGEITDPYVAAQLLALPIAAKIQDDNSLINNLDKIVERKQLTSEYAKYVELIGSDVAIRGGVYGFSQDFLELKDDYEINAFLRHSVIEYASRLGLINDEQLSSTFADQLRKEILYLLKQDTTHRYGSIEHVKASLITMYSSVGSVDNQFNKANILFDTNMLNNIEPSVFNSDEIDEIVKQKYDVDSLSSIYEYFLLAQYSEDPHDLDVSFAREILGQSRNVSVDYDRGLITSSERSRGYLGLTYLHVASDLYGKDILKLSPEEIFLTRSALNLIGIDTNHPYGSLRNIQASLLMRVDSSLDTSVFSEEISEGSAEEMLAALNARHGLDFSEPLKDLLYESYIFSNVAGLSDDDVYGSSVKLYSEFDQKGIKKLISSDEAWMGNLDDNIKSFDIPEGWQVRFFEEPNFGGRYYTRNSGKNNTTGFSDKVSSIRVLRKPDGAAVFEGVKLYLDRDRQGTYTTITEDLPRLGPYDRAISSWTIPEGWQVRFYSGENYTGRYYTRNAGSANASSGIDNHFRSVQILEKPAKYANDHKQILYDFMINANTKSKLISSYEKIVDYDADGTAIYSVPLSDESYARAMLFEIGFDKAFVDQNWHSFLMQKNVRPSINQYYNSWNPAPGAFQTNLSHILDSYENESNRSRYNVHDMWSHYYNKMTENIADYISEYIVFQAKMNGKSTWSEVDFSQFNVRLNTGYNIEKTRRYSSWQEIETIPPKKWMITGDGINYSARVGNSLFDILDMDHVEILPQIGLSTTNTSPLFRYLNDDRHQDCIKPPSQSADTLVIKCKADFITRGSRTNLEQNAISHLIDEYFEYKKTEFKTIKTNDVLLEVLKGLLPLWGTIESIQANDVTGATLGIIGDIFFFVPVAGEVIDTTRYAVKAIKLSKLASKIRLAKTPVALKGGDSIFALAGEVDTAFYLNKALKSAQRIPLSALNELTPISLGNLDDILSVGRIDIPKPPTVRPISPANDDYFQIGKYIDAISPDSISSVIENGDGMYIINESFTAFYHDGAYYKLSRDAYGNNYLVTNNGMELPLINDSGTFSINEDLNIGEYNLSGFNQIDFVDDSAVTMSNGIIKVDDETYAVLIDGVYYEAFYDANLEDWFIFSDETSDIIYLSGKHNDNWYVKNITTDVCRI